MQQEHLEILLEEMNSKFTLVLEGHVALHKEIRDTRQEFSEQFDLVNYKIEILNKKIDAVADDLTAHRSDTEVHHGLCRVKE